MIIVCNEKDCPLHPDNGWRTEQIDVIKKIIDQLSDKLLDVKTIEALHLAFSDKAEVEDIPNNCYACKYMEPIDMKKDFLVGLAKSKLLSD